MKDEIAPRPPPLLLPRPPRSSTRLAKIIIAVVASVAVTGGVCIYLVVHYVTTSGITRPIDNMFGDQHLKTVVALVELHKTRYGRYPQTLRELKFTGEWDQLPLNAVSYRANREGTAYYVEVERGWAGKPLLQMPPEFWQGTGFSENLKPSAR
jgi:hypothetical protein